MIAALKLRGENPTQRWTEPTWLVHTPHRDIRSFGNQVGSSMQHAMRSTWSPIRIVRERLNVLGAATWVTGSFAIGQVLRLVTSVILARLQTNLSPRWRHPKRSDARERYGWETRWSASRVALRTLPGFQSFLYLGGACGPAMLARSIAAWDFHLSV